MKNMMKQAQMMQKNMQKAQEKFARKEFVGEAGAGLVKVTMTGGYEAKRVDIDASLLSDDDDDNKGMLEDLIAAGINAATRNIKQESEGMMSGLTAGLKIPGMS
ncbi:MAG: YbaB/EbfC family nucleoid-associated protein [Gammaproteobacteria bacterium]|nr:YbaB/EbfC family nucleoid-associated protein [Gammaproteobacteria bacterium]